MPAPLTDTFGRQHTYLRIAVTERCNLRCRYCMPVEGVELSPRESILTFEEIDRLARLFARLGVDKIRLTGGEPLVRRDLPVLVEMLASIPGLRALALTTNGTLLARNLPALRAAGLTHLNISLDTLDPRRFERITHRSTHAAVLEAIDAALDRGYHPVKINCVVMRGVNDDELPAFVELTRHRDVEVRFIEYMPFAGNAWSGDLLVPYSEMLLRIEAEYPALERLEGHVADTAKVWQAPGFRGRVGFVTSMTDAFCTGCNRLRITADGSLKTCLFGGAEVKLRDLMRQGADDAQLAAVVQAAVLRKKPAHDGLEVLPSRPNRPMILIGG